MIEYSYSRAELLNSIPAYILDTSSKKDIVSILCKMLKLDIVRCSNIKFVKSKLVTSKLIMMNNLLKISVYLQNNKK